MIGSCLTAQRPLLAILAACVVTGLAGCHSIDFYDQSLEAPAPPEMEPPREKSLMSLPSYRIAPPDVLQIEMVKLVPRPPYRAETFDVLQIQVVGTLLDQPIADYYLVEADGTVNLGPAYGKVRVVGMTIQEIEEAIRLQLGQLLREPEVSVQLARSAGVQEITGQYLVGPDGTINLRQYGQLYVAGRTVAEAKVALQEHLSHYFDSPEAAVSLLGYNSKFYYVITEGAGLGDNVTRVPITGKETVLDALSNVGGVSQLSSKQMWVARPAPGESNCEQVLPIDYVAITRGGSAATNYQLMPGDRLFVAEDSTLALTNFVTKLTDPIERILGTGSLGASTIRNFQTTGREYNKLRR